MVINQYLREMADKDRVLYETMCTRVNQFDNRRRLEVFNIKNCRMDSIGVCL